MSQFTSLGDGVLLCRDKLYSALQNLFSSLSSNAFGATVDYLTLFVLLVINKTGVLFLRMPQSEPEGKDDQTFK